MATACTSARVAVPVAQAPNVQRSTRAPVARGTSALRTVVARRSATTQQSSRRAVSVRPQASAAAAATAEDIAAMNAQFGIPGRVEVVAGRGGLPTVRLTHACGASAEVVLFGGVVTSFKQASGDEILYIRPDAVFDKSKPISGGIPHCFPQFGPGAMQQHGFARNLDWAISSTSADPQPDDQEPEVTLLLTDNEYTRKMWPHAFQVAYSITLHGELLKADMRVINKGDTPLEFTAALHTYLEVDDVEKAKVKGLTGLTYLDKTVDANNPAKKVEDREDVTFAGPVDSVYLKAKEYVELDVGTGAAVAMTSNSWSDIVVWSPWTSMPDCYRSFVCVEHAQFSESVKLGAGEFWRSQAEWGVKDL